MRSKNNDYIFFTNVKVFSQIMLRYLLKNKFKEMKVTVFIGSTTKKYTFGATENFLQELKSY